jgi:ubiquinol-cytochrome c reductase iron-sulfur subunit
MRGENTIWGISSSHRAAGSQTVATFARDLGALPTALAEGDVSAVATETIQSTPLEEEQPTRRDFIFVAAGAFAAIGGAAALWPLIDQMNPDASALSLATTEVDISPVQEGQAITVMWRGKPVFIRHRTAQEIEQAKAVAVDDLPDPYARNLNLDDSAPATDENRAASAGEGGEAKVVHEKYLIQIGICTHLGCIPKGQAVGDFRGEFGGWFCPCHGSQYDTAGRIRKGPAPRNLTIPPYSYVNDTRIKIG